MPRKNTMGNPLSETAERAIKVFKDNRGILLTREATALGIHPQTLRRLVDQGLLDNPTRGLYFLGSEITEFQYLDLALISRRVPNAVVCLVSAAVVHELTLEIPGRVSIALPAGAWKPKVKWPPIDVFWYSEDSYQTGVDHLFDHEIELRIFNPEKTVADCFKFRNKIGLDVCIEVLRSYMKRADRKIDKLLEYSAVNRVRKIIEPYIQALI